MTAQERIDHAAEARKILHEIDNAGPDDNLPEDWCGATDDERWLVTGSLREAHVHATLALVEQQRIANLIAWSSHRLDYPNLMPGELPNALTKTFARADFEIREGLGL